MGDAALFQQNQTDPAPQCLRTHDDQTVHNVFHGIAPVVLGGLDLPQKQIGHHHVPLDNVTANIKIHVGFEQFVHKLSVSGGGQRRNALGDTHGLLEEIPLKEFKAHVFGAGEIVQRLHALGQQFQPAAPEFFDRLFVLEIVALTDVDADHVKELRDFLIFESACVIVQREGITGALQFAQFLDQRLVHRHIS